MMFDFQGLSIGSLKGSYQDGQNRFNQYNNAVIRKDRVGELIWPISSHARNKANEKRRLRNRLPGLYFSLHKDARQAIAAGGKHARRP
jgi:hypothetical protein